MSTIFDKEIVEAPCPKCGHEIKKTLGWFKGDNSCPGCDSVIEAASFVKAWEEVFQEKADLKREIDNLDISIEL